MKALLSSALLALTLASGAAFAGTNPPATTKPVAAPTSPVNTVKKPAAKNNKKTAPAKTPAKTTSSQPVKTP
jgi:hypothetical protein